MQCYHFLVTYKTVRIDPNLFKLVSYRIHKEVFMCQRFLISKPGKS